MPDHEGRWCICKLPASHTPSDHVCRACGNKWRSQEPSPECMALGSASRTATPEGNKE